MPVPDGAAGDEVDPGEPIEDLSRLDEPVSARLLPRVRASIQRRMLAAQLVELSAIGGGEVFREYVKLLLEALNRADDDRGGSR